MSRSLLEVEHQVEDPDPDRDVEHRDRLVGEDHRRLDGKRAGDRDALPLAAGELVRILRRDRLRRDETDGAQELVDALVDLVCCGTMRWMRSGRSMWCATVLTGFSEPNGSWKIICTCER